MILALVNWQHGNVVTMYRGTVEHRDNGDVVKWSFRYGHGDGNVVTWCRGNTVQGLWQWVNV